MSREAALRRELEGYERSGNKERADQVRADLDRLAAPPAPPEPISVTDDPATAADDPAEKPKPRSRKKAADGE